MNKYFDENANDYIYTVGDGKIEYLVDEVEPNEDMTLKVVFADGSIKKYDMKPKISRGGVYGKLKDPELFMSAHTDGATVVWNDSIDIAPEELYENAVTIS